MTSTLLVVNNPSQLLFGLEAMTTLNLPHAEASILVVPTTRADEEAQYREILGRVRPRRVLRRDASVLTRAGRVAETVRLAALRARHDVLMTPMLHYLPVRAAARMPGRTVITDDGAYTRSVAPLRAREQRIGRLLPLPMALTFVTYYPDCVFGKDDTVVANGFGWLRQTFGAPSSPTGTAVIGSDLVGSGYLTLADYTAALRHALTETGATHALYYPHRRESAEQVAGLCEELGMVAAPRRLPLEAELMGASSPATVLSFPSTALRTLRQLRGEGRTPRLVAIDPGEQRILPGRKGLWATAMVPEAQEADVTVEVPRG